MTWTVRILFIYIITALITSKIAVEYLSKAIDYINEKYKLNSKYQLTLSPLEVLITVLINLIPLFNIILCMSYIFTKDAHKEMSKEFESIAYSRSIQQKEEFDRNNSNLKNNS